jgi:hypothetical protein
MLLFFVFMETFTKCIIFWKYLRKIRGNITIFPVYLKLENLNHILKLILYLKMKKYKMKLSWSGQYPSLHSVDKLNIMESALKPE